MKCKMILVMSALFVASIVTAEEKVADNPSQASSIQNDLTGEWVGETVLHGLNSTSKLDSPSQEFTLDVTVEMVVNFDHLNKEASEFRQIRIIQEVDHEKGGGKKGMSAKLHDSKNGKDIPIVFHYKKNGSTENQTRTVGEISRSDSGDLFLTIFPPASGIFDIGLDEFVSVNKLKLTKKYPQE